MVDITTIGFKADTSDLKKAGKELDKVATKGGRLDSSIKKTDKQIDKLGKTSNKTGKQVNSSTDKMTKGFGLLAVGIGTAYAAMKSAGHIVEVTKRFESLEMQLKTVIGSLEVAKKSFTALRELSTKMPESIDDVTTAFIRMKALGLEPTAEALLSFSNTASASGKGIMQFVEAVADASVGEFERLKEFGIKASAQGKDVAFTFQGTTTVVKKSADEISGYLQKLGENQFAGAAADQMKTLNGVVSNLSVSYDTLSYTVGNASGITSTYKSVLTELSGVFDDLNYALEEADKNQKNLNSNSDLFTDLSKGAILNLRDMSDAYESLAYKIGLVYAVLNTEVSLSTFGDIGSVWQEYKIAIDDIYTANEQFKKSLTDGKQAKSLDEIKKVINDVAVATSKGNEAIVENIALTREQTTADREAWAEAENSFLVLERRSEVLQEMTTYQKMLNEQVAEFVTQTDASANGTNAIMTQAKEMADSVDDYGDAWTRTGNKALDALGSMAAEMAKVNKSDKKYSDIMSDMREKGLDQTKEYTKIESLRAKNSVKGSMSMLDASVAMYEEGSAAQKAAHKASLVMHLSLIHI